MGARVRFLHKPAVQFQLSVFDMAESSSVGEVRRISAVAASIPFPKFNPHNVIGGISTYLYPPIAYVHTSPIHSHTPILPVPVVDVARDSEHRRANSKLALTHTNDYAVAPIISVPIPVRHLPTNSHTFQSHRQSHRQSRLQFQVSSLNSTILRGTMLPEVF